MVIVIVRILDKVIVLKGWFACNYADMNSLFDLYNDFISGNMDKCISFVSLSGCMFRMRLSIVSAFVLAMTTSVLKMKNKKKNPPPAPIFRKIWMII